MMIMNILPDHTATGAIMTPAIKPDLEVMEPLLPNRREKFDGLHLDRCRARSLPFN
jgi:hypothetical protein